MSTDPPLEDPLDPAIRLTSPAVPSLESPVATLNELDEPPDVLILVAMDKSPPEITDVAPSALREASPMLLKEIPDATPPTLAEAPMIEASLVEFSIAEVPVDMLKPF